MLQWPLQGFIDKLGPHIELKQLINLNVVDLNKEFISKIWTTT